MIVVNRDFTCLIKVAQVTDKHYVGFNLCNSKYVELVKDDVIIIADPSLLITLMTDLEAQVLVAQEYHDNAADCSEMLKISERTYLRRVKAMKVFEDEEKKETL